MKYAIVTGGTSGMGMGLDIANWSGFYWNHR